MNNLSAPSSYNPAPTASTITSTQKGGRGYHHKRGCMCPLCKKKGGSGYHHKRGCKCPLCKRRGGGDIEEDIETGSVSKEKNSEETDMKNDFNFAQENDYDDLDAAEKGEGGPFKVGGSRRRRHSKKSKKGGKSRKTRRHTRKGKKHVRKSHRRR
jgi:hypothetical protein